MYSFIKYNFNFNSVCFQVLQNVFIYIILMGPTLEYVSILLQEKDNMP